MHSSRMVPLAAAALALLSLPGCPAFTSAMKTIGVISPPKLVLAETIPQDFQLVIHVTDQKNPAADYTITFRRSGRSDYRVEAREPRRPVNEGSFDILDNQVNALWRTLREVRYDELADRYPEDGVGPDRNLGVQGFNVSADNLDKEVQAHFRRVPELEKIRGLALSFLPDKAMKDTGSAPTEVGNARQIVGDLQTKIFYAADDPRLKDVPADRRQPFSSWYDAVNFGFSPAVGYKPWDRRE